MIGWLLRIFRATQETQAKAVSVGARYRLRNQRDNPFCEPYLATVIEVKRGWVQYQIASARWAEKVDVFLRMYELESKLPNENAKTMRKTINETQTKDKEP